MISYLLSGAQNVLPTVGMGASQCFISDRSACTIIEVSKSGRTVTVQSDKATRTDKNGLSEDQDYTFEPNPNGSTQVYTLRANGRYVAKGCSMRGTPALMVGERSQYRDPSF